MVIEQATFKGKSYFFNPDVYLPEFQREMFREESRDMEAWWNVNANDVVVDVGAGTGSWALPAAAQGASIICFECDPMRVHALRANVAVNKDMQMTIDSRGLYSKECELDMDMNSSSVMLQLGYNPTQRVKMVTLDQLNVPSSKIDYLKIDVEGAELHVLAGAEQTIRKYKPKIICECHVFIVPNIDGYVLGWLNRLELGYKITCVQRRSTPGAQDLRSYVYSRLYCEIE